jgi:hypothetical protein
MIADAEGEYVHSDHLKFLVGDLDALIATPA